MRGVGYQALWLRASALFILSCGNEFPWRLVMTKTFNELDSVPLVMHCEMLESTCV